MTRVATILFSALALASCARGPATATVEDAEVRLAAAPGLPSAGYFTLTMSRSDDALLSVSSPSAERIEMHENRERDGITSMARLDSVPAGGGAPIRFQPGGKHLMIFGLRPQVQPGGQIELVMTFAQAAPVRVTAGVVAPAGGGGDPGHAGH